MKQRSTTPAPVTFATKAVLVAVTVMTAVAGVTGYVNQPVFARDFDAEIRAKQQEAAAFQAEANRLAGQANTLQAELNVITSQINQIQAEIDANQRKHDQLVQEIEQNQKRIEENRDLLGDILSDIYVDDQISPLEMLASSSSIGDYIDKQEQHSSMQTALNEKIKEIKVLQAKLEKDRAAVKKILEDQKHKRQELGAKEATQKDLLDKTKGDEAAYQQLVANKQGEIEQLRQARQALLSRSVSPGVVVSAFGTGGYPYAGVGYPCWSASCADPWGLYYRECTSYVAWRLSASGRRVIPFGGAGHAYQWPGTTAGYTSQRFGHSPQVGDAAVLPANTGGAAWTGHVMYVEEVHGNGSIVVSEYNWNGNGLFGKRRLSPAEYSVMTFITFPAG